MERMWERKQERIPKILCKVLLGNFQIQFFFSQETNRERETCNRTKGRRRGFWLLSEIGLPTTVPQPIVGDEMSSEREREREFSKSSHLVWRMVEQNENGLSKRVSKDFIWKLVFWILSLCERETLSRGLC